MSFVITGSGMTIQTYQEIFDELATAYRLIYGADINLDADSADGQRVGIEAKARLDLQSVALSIYNQLDPDFAVGSNLNSLIKLAGIVRRPATRSQVDVDIVVTKDLTLPIGYEVKDDLDQIWLTIAAVPLLTGSNAVTLYAENFGAVEALAGTVTTPATIVIGVSSVTNALAATQGADEETDEALRIRREQSIQAPVTSSIGGMFTALGNVAGVTDVVVYENDTAIDDVITGIPAHSIWCIVEGGTVADIVEAMAKNKTGGVDTWGIVSGAYIETVTKPDLTTFDIVHQMDFDRPLDVPLYISMTIQGTGVDSAAIKAAIAARVMILADAIAAGELYQDAYSVGTDYIVTLLQISDDDITYTDGSLSPGYGGKFSIDVANITITLI